MQRRLRMRFTGTVQGVGFRYTAQRLASHFPGITGTVRNVPDGSVELIAEGSDTDLAAFADGIEHRMAGYVRQADRCYSPARGDFVGFRIAH